MTREKKKTNGRFEVTEDGKLVEDEDAEPSFSLEFDEDEDEDEQ